MRYRAMINGKEVEAEATGPYGFGATHWPYIEISGISHECRTWNAHRGYSSELQAADEAGTFLESIGFTKVDD